MGDISENQAAEQEAGTLNRFKDAVEEFYEVYKKAKEKHNLRIETCATFGKGCIIKIYRGTGAEKQLILKEEEKDAADCYKKAKEALTGWEATHK